VNTFMNVSYHKEADVFCTAIVTIVTIISSGRFLDVKVTSCKHIIQVFLMVVEKKPV
jgi:hypothetical protein